MEQRHDVKVHLANLQKYRSAAYQSKKYGRCQVRQSFTRTTEMGLIGRKRGNIASPLFRPNATSTPQYAISAERRLRPVAGCSSLVISKTAFRSTKLARLLAAPAPLAYLL